MTAPANLPSSRTPFIDIKTGIPTPYFYQFLLNLLTNSGGPNFNVSSLLAAIAMSDTDSGDVESPIQAYQTIGDPQDPTPPESQAALMSQQMADAPEGNPVFGSVRVVGPSTAAIDVSRSSGGHGVLLSSGGDVATVSGDLVLNPQSGVVQLGTTTYISGVLTATGTISIKDSTGTVYKLLAHT